MVISSVRGFDSPGMFSNDTQYLKKKLILKLKTRGLTNMRICTQANRNLLFLKQSKRFSFKRKLTHFQNLRFFDVFRGYRNGTLIENGLKRSFLLQGFLSYEVYK